MRYTLFLIILFFNPVSKDQNMLNYVDIANPVWISPDSYSSDCEPDGILKVVSYNIEFGIRFDQAAKELSSYPLRDADIVLLQEMDEHGTIFIAEQLNYNYLYFPFNNHPKHGRKFGNAILSKWPISTPEKIILPHRHPLSRLKRGITSATIEYGNVNIKTYSLHLETPVLWRTKRMEQLQWAMDHLEQYVNDEPVIFGGDFNSATPWDVRDMVGLCLDNDLHWNTRDVGPTYSRLGVIRPTLDHIFSRGFEPLASGKMNLAVASDHIPIWTQIQLNQK